MAEGGRKLGLTELMQEYLTSRFNASIYFQAAVLRSTYRFTVDEFIESLKILVNFQPLLRMKVLKESGLAGGRDNYFFRSCEVNVSSLLRVRIKSDGEKWAAIIKEEEELLSREERFGDGPEWRVVLSTPEELLDGLQTISEPLYTYDVVFVMKHAIADGVSCYDLVYRQLLPILNSIVNENSPDDTFLHPLELTPCYEEVFFKMRDSADIAVPWYIKLGMNMFRAANRMFKERLYEPLFKSEDSPYDEDGAEPYTRVIDEDLLDRLLLKRRENSVSIHSILLTALSFAILKLFQKREKQVPKVVKGNWPIDSRKFDAKFKSPQPLGVFTASSGILQMKVPSTFETSKEMFWKKAKDINHDVKRDSKQQSYSFNLKAFAYIVEGLGTVENYCDFVSEFDIRTHYILSNLAKCSPGPELTKTSPNFIDADEIYFGVCGKGFGAMNYPFFVTAVNHKNKIFLANCYSRKWISREFVCEFMDFLQDMLIMACQEDAN